MLKTAKIQKLQIPLFGFNNSIKCKQHTHPFNRPRSWSSRTKRPTWLFCRSTSSTSWRFLTRLDLADFRSTWSTCGHFDHNFLLVLAHWQLTRKILCPSTWWLPTPRLPVPSGRPSFPFLLPHLNIFVVGSCDHKMRSMRPVAKLVWLLVELYQRHCGRENECGI